MEHSLEESSAGVSTLTGFNPPYGEIGLIK